MFEKKIIVLCLVLPFLPGTHLVLGQGGSRAAAYVKAAKEKAENGDYAAAISLYARAIEAEPGPAQRQKIQGALDEVTRSHFTELYDQALRAPSRDEKVKLLVQARSLTLRDWLFTDFEKVVISAQSLTNQIFDELRKEASAVSGRRDYDQALHLYTQARRLDPIKFGNENLETEYQAIQEEVRNGKELAGEGRRLLQQGQYPEAKEKFREAQAAYPGQATVEAGLRRADSMLLVQEGKKHAGAGRFRAAEGFFQTALRRDADNEQATRLLQQSQNYREHVHTGRVLYRQGQCKQSKREFVLAQEADPGRFREDNLEVVLSGGCSQTIPVPVVDLREALLSLFGGEPQNAAEILEILAEEVGESHLQVRAFLGAAYCYLAFLSAQPDSASLEKAKEQFRQVLRSNRDYQLSEKLFAPKVREVFEELRSESP